MKNLMIPAILLVSACAGPEPTQTSSPNEVTSEKCPVISVSDPAMWINAMPGPNNNPTLITNFTATTPTPGYAFDLNVLEVKESAPPQYVFDLITTPPEGNVIQVLHEAEVRIEIANFAYDEIASATVKCGGSELFSVESVETAH